MSWASGHACSFCHEWHALREGWIGDTMLSYTPPDLSSTVHRWEVQIYGRQHISSEPRRVAVSHSRCIGVDEIQGREACHAGKFPYEELAQWIRKAYSEGFSPDFVPALLRNIKGLVAWVYGGEGEPCWPGSDYDDEAQDLG